LLANPIVLNVNPILGKVVKLVVDFVEARVGNPSNRVKVVIVTADFLPPSLSCPSRFIKVVLVILDRLPTGLGCPRLVVKEVSLLIYRLQAGLHYPVFIKVVVDVLDRLNARLGCASGLVKVVLGPLNILPTGLGHPGLVVKKVNLLIYCLQTFLKLPLGVKGVCLTANRLHPRSSLAVLVLEGHLAILTGYHYAAVWQGLLGRAIILGRLVSILVAVSLAALVSGRGP